jgi:outer membrane protein
MHSIVKTLLIACIVALPTLAAVADAAPVAEAKPLAPVSPAVSATPLTVSTENKPEVTIAAPAIQTTHFGYVDISRVGSESDRGIALKALLTTQKDKLQGKLDAKKKQIEKLKASIEAKLPQMTPPQREAKSKEFQKKMEEFQKFVRSSEEELFKLQDKETKSLYEEIEKAAVAHGKENKLALIVVKRDLLYVGPAVDAQDLTDALIKAVNASGQKK